MTPSLALAWRHFSLEMGKPHKRTLRQDVSTVVVTLTSKACKGSPDSLARKFANAGAILWQAGQSEDEAADSGN